LKAVQFQHPEWTPVTFGFSPATWKKYREELEAVLLEHPRIFPGYQKGQNDFDHAAAQMSRLDPDGASFREEGEVYRDSWGCLWRCAYNDLGGQVIEHPLADWKAFDGFRPPDILKKTRWGSDREDWDAIKRRIEETKKKGLLATTRIPCFFDRLHYLRGFENLLCDFASDEPKVSKLLEMLLETNLKLIDKLVGLGADVVDHHGDIGTQRALMMKPETFRKYLKPCYAAMFQPFRKAGTAVRYSSDGLLLTIIDDLAECGVSAHDPQYGVNTPEGIAKAYGGKVCANIDFGQEIALMTPEQLDESVKSSVSIVGSPAGGATIRVWAIPDAPLTNIKAFCDAAEKYCF
jgi:hypothetical protein